MTQMEWGWSAGVAALVLLGSVPYWLPGAVVALRVRIFAMVNGEEGVSVPGGRFGAEEFKQLYADPAANGRSKGAALSDLFWYWLAPGPQVHQEHLEPGPRYDSVARSTRRILTRLSKDEWEALVGRVAGRTLDELQVGRTRTVRLRDVMMPVWAEVYYELVFGEPCPAQARDLITANANDVVSALKCTHLRHMGRRDRLTRYLVERIEAGRGPEGLSDALSVQEQAYYLQGTYFNTAVVQMSEAMAHLLMVVAANPEIQQRLRDEPGDVEYLDRIIDETLRMYPLFGVAHRITSREIVVGDAAIPGGSVLLFNYPAFHHSGTAGADRFDPERWLRADAGQIRNIPFGVSANRPCPARGVAPLSMRAATREVVRRFALATSAGHTRSLPNRGPCLVTPTAATPEPAARTQVPAPAAARLAALRVRDRWEDVWRSVVQLVLGTYMVFDARRLRLCRNYFAGQEAGR
ncbi:MAG TPA: cytochrome P450 [Actinocrinis sp.]|nr:cytochrome P450 [Actinocrinis sp.]